MIHYLDTSALVPILVSDALTGRARAWLALTAGQVLISDLAEAEFAAAIGAKLRRGEIARATAERSVTALDRWAARCSGRPRIESTDLTLAQGWLRPLDTTLRAPDAIHLAIAARQGAPVATFDVGMAAAGRRLGLAVTLI